MTSAQIPDYSSARETFGDYVRRTSKPEAQAKRLLLADVLQGQTHLSANTLVAAIKGNSGDRGWVSQAIRDGFIRRSEVAPFHLCKGSGCRVPSPRELAQDFTRGVLAWADANPQADIPLWLVTANVTCCDFLEGRLDSDQDPSQGDEGDDE